MEELLVPKEEEPHTDAKQPHSEVQEESSRDG